MGEVLGYARGLGQSGPGVEKSRQAWKRRWEVGNKAFSLGGHGIGILALIGLFGSGVRAAATATRLTTAPDTAGAEQSMPNLTHYFSNRELADKALDRYMRFAVDRRWCVGGPYGKSRLYQLGRQAFSQGSSLPVAELAFREAYGIVRSWPGVQRGGTLASWDDVFKAIRSGCGRLVGQMAGDLSSLAYPSPSLRAMERFLSALSFIKPTKRYPWMPVSKILHICNPGLFPIWDVDVMWNQVMWERAPFRREYAAFCQSRGFNPTTNEHVFNLNYTLWAASYIQDADSDFMTWFGAWLGMNYRSDIAAARLEQAVSTLYATAFEFVAIGAAYLETGD